MKSRYGFNGSNGRCPQLRLGLSSALPPRTAVHRRKERGRRPGCQAPGRSLHGASRPALPTAPMPQRCAVPAPPRRVAQPRSLWRRSAAEHHGLLWPLPAAVAALPRCAVAGGGARRPRWRSPGEAAGRPAEVSVGARPSAPRPFSLPDSGANGRVPPTPARLCRCPAHAMLPPAAGPPLGPALKPGGRDGPSGGLGGRVAVRRSGAVGGMGARCGAEARPGCGAGQARPGCRSPAGTERACSGARRGPGRAVGPSGVVLTLRFSSPLCKPGDKRPGLYRRHLLVNRGKSSSLPHGWKFSVWKEALLAIQLKMSLLFTGGWTR